MCLCSDIDLDLFKRGVLKPQYDHPFILGQYITPKEFATHVRDAEQHLVPFVFSLLFQITKKKIQVSTYYEPELKLINKDPLKYQQIVNEVAACFITRDPFKSTVAFVEPTVSPVSQPLVLKLPEQTVVPASHPLVVKSLEQIAADAIKDIASLNVSTVDCTIACQAEPVFEDASSDGLEFTERRTCVPDNPDNAKKKKKKRKKKCNKSNTTDKSENVICTRSQRDGQHHESLYGPPLGIPFDTP